MITRNAPPPRSTSDERREIEREKERDVDPSPSESLETGESMELSRHERISRRAHELFLARGGDHGQDQDDWLAAEHEIDGGAGDDWADRDR